MTSNQEWMNYLASAARAAGVVGQAVERMHAGRLIAVIEREDGTFWMPHIDMGHALWLAVKLEINILPTMERASCRNPEYTGWINEDATHDPYSATCRAIVRAAAEMSKAGAK